MHPRPTCPPVVVGSQEAPEKGGHEGQLVFGWGIPGERNMKNMPTRVHFSCSLVWGQYGGCLTPGHAFHVRWLGRSVRGGAGLVVHVWQLGGGLASGTGNVSKIEEKNEIASVPCTPASVHAPVHLSLMCCVVDVVDDQLEAGRVSKSHVDQT